jgi:hypothetical protein
MHYLTIGIVGLQEAERKEHQRQINEYEAAAYDQILAPRLKAFLI